MGGWAGHAGGLRILHFSSGNFADVGWSPGQPHGGDGLRHALLMTVGLMGLLGEFTVCHQGCLLISC